jgi:hypothetical protein
VALIAFRSVEHDGIIRRAAADKRGTDHGKFLEFFQIFLVKIRTLPTCCSLFIEKLGLYLIFYVYFLRKLGLYLHFAMYFLTKLELCWI